MAALLAICEASCTETAEPEPLEQRSREDRLDIPVRRDGGIQDLLERVESADRGFDAVICESVDRIARRTYVGVVVWHLLPAAALGRVGVTLGGGRRLPSAVQGGLAELPIPGRLRDVLDSQSC